MEPRQFEKSMKPRSEVQTSPPRQPERKRRFQIIKLEERIAPGGPPPPTAAFAIDATATPTVNTAAPSGRPAPRVRYAPAACRTRGSLKDPTPCPGPRELFRLSLSEVHHA
jgi:hypothetical protein